MRFSSTLLRLFKRLAAVLTTSCALSLVLVCSPFVSGCFNAPSPAKVQQPVNSDISNLIASPNGQDSGCESTGSLHELWQQRNRENNSSAYPVGPGDVLQVTVTDLPEINKNQMPVSTGKGKLPCRCLES